MTSTAPVSVAPVTAPPAAPDAPARTRSGWPGVIALVAAANPNTSPKKDQTKCISKINYARSTSTPAAV